MRDFRLTIICLMLSLLSVQTRAQNLVPNYDFEKYNFCPNGLSGIAYSPNYTSFPTIKDWVNPVYHGSPDYFNACSPASLGIQVPNVAFGYQMPHSGDAYIGLNLWQGEYQGGSLVTDYREYVQCKLTQPMVAGKKYCVNFYVSPTVDIFGNFNYVSVDEIGANFSTSQQTASAGYTMNLSYHIRSTSGALLADTGRWLKVSGSFVATGNEQWMTIGCFDNSSSIPQKAQAYPIPANSSYNTERAYVYLDDITVYMISDDDTVTTFYDSSFCTWSALPMLLKSASPDANADFSWNTGENSKDIVVTSSGIYVCTAKTECQVYIDSFLVEFKEDTKLDFKTDFINCDNKPIEIIPNKVFDIYTWSTGETTPTINVNTSGFYILTATNRCGTQTDTARAYIQSPTDPPIVHDTIFCQLVEDPQFRVEGENLNWYAHPSAIIGLPVQPQIVTRELGMIRFYVSQTKGKCESIKVPVTADVKYQPRHVLDDKAVMCINNIQLIGKDWSPDLTYKWGTGEGGCCIVPTREGLHKLAITSPYCGTYIDSIQVVFSLCDTCIIVPNAFSPNHDGKNDEFKAILICPADEYSMSIFDRWGRKVFNSLNVNEGWNGRTNGELADNGIYIYTIEYRSVSTGMKKFLKGNVTLVR